MGRIVVDVDGSDGSRRALRWAADEARLRGAGLEVVYAYEYHGSWLAYGVYEGATSAAQVDAIRAVGRGAGGPERDGGSRPELPRCGSWSVPVVVGASGAWCSAR
jgi:nucleotide-binding universal stress UspA family protein